MECPSCGEDNIQGEDLCASCGMDLAGLDVRSRELSREDPLLARKIDELPLKKALTVAPTTSVGEAARLMREHHEGCVFVVTEGEGLVGVFTERDLASRVLVRDRSLDETTVAEVMTRDPYTLRGEDRVVFALHRMGVDGYRHLPILDAEGKIIGILTMRTVLAALASA